MGDYSTPFRMNPVGGVINSSQPPFVCAGLAELDVLNFTAGAWPSANRALYMMFVIDQPVTALQMFWENGGVAGTTDVGIYDATSLDKLVTLGATTNSGATTQFGDIADTLLVPGCYYAGMVASTVTTQTYWSMGTVSKGDMSGTGCLQQTLGSATLPATMAGAAIATGYLPLVGIQFASTM